MNLLEIVQIGHPVLRQRAVELSRDELLSVEVQGFIDDLIATMRHAKGAGLAANQVDRPVRVCAMEVEDNPRYPYKPRVPLTVLVNPILTPVGPDTFDNYEGCLSVPDLRGEVSRHAEVRVQAWDRQGETIDRVVRGITAGTFQHECDHLEGRLFVDGVTDPTTFCTWSEFERRHHARVVERVGAIVAKYGS